MQDDEGRSGADQPDGREEPADASLPTQELPPIETWWGRLSQEARAEVLGHLHGPLPDRARAEIAEAIGRPLPDDATLSRIDVGYVETQQQPVD